MVFEIIFKNKIRKAPAVFLSVILIIPLWHIERSKRIDQYGTIFYEMGLRCEDKCREDKTFKYFKKAVRHNPAISDARYQLALIYENRGNQPKALEYFQRVTELDHTNALAYYRVGLQYYNDGDYENARRYLLQTYRRRECPEDATYYLGMIHDQMKEYDLAIGFYKSMVVINNEYAAKAYSRLARIYYVIDREDALRYEVSSLRGSGKNDLADQLEQNYKTVVAREASKTSYGEMLK